MQCTSSGATVSVNGKLIGSMTSQFVRYTFDVRALLERDKPNVLEVTFDSRINTFGRYMPFLGGRYMPAVWQVHASAGLRLSSMSINTNYK